MALTEKQSIFCSEFVKLDNASAAYRNAYNTSKMTDKSVNENASRLLNNVKVSSRVIELQAIAAEIAEKEFRIDATELLNHLNILRKSRIDQFVDFVEIESVVGLTEAGEEIKTRERVLQFKPFDELSEEQLMCIESIKDTRNGIELKLHGKDWTIEKIAKHIGFYAPIKTDITTGGEKLNASKPDLSKLSPEALSELLNTFTDDGNGAQ
jgi:phage terminase small subunit